MKLGSDVAVVVKDELTTERKVPELAEAALDAHYERTPLFVSRREHMHLLTCQQDVWESEISRILNRWAAAGRDLLKPATPPTREEVPYD